MKRANRYEKSYLFVFVGLPVNVACCVMTAGFVGAVHNIQFPAAFGGNIFAGDSLHAVAGAAKTGEIDFNDFLFHGKPP